MARFFRTFETALTSLLIIVIFAGVACADGFIVPVRPDIRVRGRWAVKYHHVDIRVRDQVAAVAIDQKFVNTGRGMIEVEYLFPVPPGAAIDSMTLVVDGREFAARLLDAKKARKIYEDIVRRKKDPALLEYAGFGLYRTRAFPLLPGKPVRVQVTYKQVCRKDGRAVEVWYPLNTEKFSARKIESVRVTVDVKSPADITNIYSPTHKFEVKRRQPNHVIATYHEKDTLPTTDVQIFFKSANEDVAATVLTHQPRGNRDGYFLMLISPNPKPVGDKITPKDVVIVFDHSGSMASDKLRQAKSAVEYILKNLNKSDRFNVVAYNDAVEAFFDKMAPADKKYINQAMESVDRIDASGGTNIHEALISAMRFLCGGGSRPRYIIFLTDGTPTVGKTAQKEILADVKRQNTAGARLFAFGLGYDVNVPLLDKLANENLGRSDYVKPAEPVERKIRSLYNKIKNPVMTGLKVELKGVRLRDMYPRRIGDLFEGDQIVLAGRYDGRDVAALPPGGREPSYHTQLVITGMYAGRERAFEYPVRISPSRRRGYDFVEKIWAVRRVGYLMDQVQLHGETREVVDELIRMSKRYGIMTPYTSFLADETTPLARPVALRARATKSLEHLRKSETGGRAQRGADMRRRLNTAEYAMKPSAPGESSAVMFGNKTRTDYEADKKEHVANVRQVGNQAVYKRGRLWVAANASSLDVKKDAGKIQTVRRFSGEYFDLVRANTTAENQVLASQRDDEELLINLRGQAYLIR